MNISCAFSHFVQYHKRKAFLNIVKILKLIIKSSILDPWSFFAPKMQQKCLFCLQLNAATWLILHKMTYQIKRYCGEFYSEFEEKCGPGSSKLSGTVTILNLNNRGDLELEDKERPGQPKKRLKTKNSNHCSTWTNPKCFRKSRRNSSGLNTCVWAAH